MNSWFTCKIKYDTIENNGKEKSVTEPYLVDAVSFTEAEARIYKKLEEELQGEFVITNITKTKVSDIFFHDDAEVWYKCKVTFIDVEEKSGKEKKTTNFMFVTANNVKDAYDKLEEDLSTMLIPYEIPSIQESPIVDVFPYDMDESVENTIPENFKPVDKFESEDSEG